MTPAEFAELLDREYREAGRDQEWPEPEPCPYRGIPRPITEVELFGPGARRMLDLRRAGKTLRQIAAEYGLSPERIRQVLRSCARRWEFHQAASRPGPLNARP